MAGLETLDEAAPRDTDAVSLGDDAIRETRQKTKTSVGVEHYLDGRHKVPGGTTAERPEIGTERLKGSLILRNTRQPSVL